MSAEHFHYYDDWKTKVLCCSACGWTGTFQQGQVDYHGDCMASSCPKCGGGIISLLAVVNFPTLKETAANWERLTDFEKAEYQQKVAFRDQYQRESLRSPNDLPELDGAELEMTWDFITRTDGDHRTIIRSGDRVVCDEPAVWEGFERFAEVVQMLQGKYGARLVDLIPTEASELYLYGDRVSSMGTVAEIRRKLRAVHQGRDLSDT